MLRGEATHTHLIVFSLTPPELEPKIYHTPGEHANHRATEAVPFALNMYEETKYTLKLCSLYQINLIWHPSLANKNNAVIKLPIYFTSHMCIALEIMDIISKWFQVYMIVMYALFFFVTYVIIFWIKYYLTTIYRL